MAMPFWKRACLDVYAAAALAALALLGGAALALRAAWRAAGRLLGGAKRRKVD